MTETWNLSGFALRPLCFALSRLLAVLAIGALSFAHSQTSARVSRSCLCLCSTHVVACLVCLHLVAGKSAIWNRALSFVIVREIMVLGTSSKWTTLLHRFKPEDDPHCKLHQVQRAWHHLRSIDQPQCLGRPRFDGFCDRSSTSTFLCYLRFNQVPHQPMVSYHSHMPSTKLYSSVNQINTEVDTIIDHRSSRRFKQQRFQLGTVAS